MDEITNTGAVNNLYLLFAIATTMLLAWLFEAVWNNDKRWLLPVIVFPLSIIIFVLKYWQETRARCFFIALLGVTLLIVGGLVDVSIIKKIIALLQYVAFWPYYGFGMIYQQLM
jgi:hypothetical protein